jgi:macrolide-specific efflux system membrane fusion protein
MKKRYVFITLAILLIIVSISIGYYKQKNITLLNVKKGDVLEAIYGLGKVHSRQSFEVKIGIMTNVEKVFVKEGDLVKKGDKVISFSGMTLFRAPFAGTITLVELKEGEIALPQVPIVRLENLSDKYIEVSLEQDAALKVKQQQQAQIIFENLKSAKLFGEVKSIYPKKGEFIAHIELESLPSNILPGMTADVVIEVGKKHNVMLIPNKAITEGRVVRYRNEKKEVIPVEIGNTDGIWAELITGDIQESDQLMVKGKQ